MQKSDYWKREIEGVQFITYEQMKTDIEEYVLSGMLNQFNSIIGIPRSGLTVAHMISSYLNCKAGDFRQSSGRNIKEGDNTLVVDDCCSFGNAINQVKSQMGPAKYLAVYARSIGVINCGLDYWIKTHAEPNWLVITEWNWMHHQDCPYISISSEILSYNPSGRFCHVYNKIDIDHFNDSQAILLVMKTTNDDAKTLSQYSDKVILNLNSMKLFGPDDKQWSYS